MVWFFSHRQGANLSPFFEFEDSAEFLKLKL